MQTAKHAAAARERNATAVRKLLLGNETQVWDESFSIIVIFLFAEADRQTESMVLFYFNLEETETKGARACGIIKMFFLFISEVVGGSKNVAAAEIVRRKMKRFIKARGSVCMFWKGVEWVPASGGGLVIVSQALKYEERK